MKNKKSAELFYFNFYFLNTWVFPTLIWGKFINIILIQLQLSGKENLKFCWYRSPVVWSCQDSEAWPVRWPLRAQEEFCNHHFVQTRYQCLICPQPYISVTSKCQICFSMKLKLRYREQNILLILFTVLPSIAQNRKVLSRNAFLTIYVTLPNENFLLLIS